MEKEKKKNLHFQRYEFKYRLSTETVDNLIPEFLKYMNWDPFAADKPEKKYQVASLYYDSPQLDCYYEKIAGIKKRKKLRLRVYDREIRPDSEVYIEIKRKDDLLILKDRVVARHEDCCRALLDGEIDNFIKGRPEYERNFLSEFFWTKKHNSLKPKVMVIYNRMSLVSKLDKELRITLDSDIKTYPASWIDLKTNAIAVDFNFVILELKYNKMLPAWLNDIIKDNQLEQISCSKYCMAVDACIKNH